MQKRSVERVDNPYNLNSSRVSMSQEAVSGGARERSTVSSFGFSWLTRDNIDEADEGVEESPTVEIPDRRRGGGSSFVRFEGVGGMS